MEYLKLPNLPDKKVNKIIIAQDCPDEIIKSLYNYGVELIKSARLNKIDDATSTHPDMSILHMGENRFFCANSAFDYYQQMLGNVDIQPLSKEISSPYPLDAGLNAAILGKNVFLCAKSINEQIFEEVEHLQFRVIQVKQGYAKCNLVPVSENALITEDASIYHAAIHNGLDALKIHPGNISLNGYPHGFIGGACGKLDKNTLAITGKLSYLPEAESIIAFCKNHGVELLELGNLRPCDIGSILPIA
ncbi:MAG: hypothetical protein IJD83_07325 [Clostridia bacterium]|nr:hypothetical protein [Clostridia bacterium]